MFGDGDETTFNFTSPASAEFINPRAFYFFENDIKVASGGFVHHATRADLVTSAGTATTIYWPVSGSTAVDLPYSGTLAQSGTLFYSNATLTQAAANGFYYPTGFFRGAGDLVGTFNNTSNLVFGVRTGSKDNILTEIVPRIYTASFTPQS